ncbi:hypothetical protein C8R44DRAFT_862383 [Mycena epipterygia]|nr:hypothetical protein C8R44DRAFT_862383 [Mycena epipterygia]
MPHQPTVTEIHLNGIIACLTPTVTLLNELTDAFATPFIRAISSTTLSLITAVQNVKRNKEECVRLMENIHGILYAIINLHIRSEIAGSLPPATLNQIGNFTETLHKIHNFLEAHQDGNKIKYFFRQNEMTALRKDCHTELEEALKVFQVETGLIITDNVAQMNKKTQDMHQELMELVANLSDDSTSDRSSSIYQSTIGSKDSSNSFSLLPGQPKIFHGRQSELNDILISLVQESAHIAILGPGGIGKTSLARAALHHPDVVAKYEHRFFVVADSVTTSIELAALIRSHLGLKPGKDLTKAVVQSLSKGPPCLLVLDNLETSWEPLQSRRGVEEFLSLLTHIPHLALIITMRGAERPAKVRWTRPFLEPLKTLSYEAARQAFIEIADDFHDSKEIDQLLHLTDNMPLAVNLIAHLVDYEGCSNVLARWETEKTSLFSAGYDKQSSLDASITISLASPRMMSCPGAKDLLSLLSILPDGLSNVELVECDIPIPDLLRSRATLLRTSLVYFDDKKRLKSLVPIREHIHTFYPPSAPLFHPLCKYFHSVMDVYEKYRGLHQNTGRVNQITSNFNNLQQLLLLEMHPHNAGLADAINCIISLNHVSRLTGHGNTGLMDHIQAVLPSLCDHRLEAKYVTEMLIAANNIPGADRDFLIHEGVAHFHHFNDPGLESAFYTAVGNYYLFRKNDMSAAAQSFEKALSLAKLGGDFRQQGTVLPLIAWLKCSIGDYSASRMLALEAQQIAQVSANLYHEATALDAELRCLRALGNLKQSVLLSQRARELVQLCGMQGGSADQDILMNLAEVHLLKSEYLEARNIYIKVSQKDSAQQNLYESSCVQLNVAEIDVIIGGDALKVQQNLDSAKTRLSTLGMFGEVNQCESILADLHLREAQGKDSQAVSYCLEKLADIGRWTSTSINWSYRWPVIYLVQAHKTQENLALHKALRFIGDVFLSERDEHTAHNLFVVALEGFTYMDVHRSRADCMLRLGDIAKHRGDLVKAVELWKEARPLFERSSQAKDILQIDTRLASVDPVMLDMHQERLAVLSELEAPTKLSDELSMLDTANSEGQEMISIVQ